jgi:hypothetical protein
MAGRTVGCWLCASPTYQGVDLHCLEQRIFLSVRHIVVVEKSCGEGSGGLVTLAGVVDRK